MILATQSGRLTNYASLAGRVGLSDKTARRYLTLLEHLFLVRRLPPWFRNPLKRLVKQPKVHFLDSGLLAAALNVTGERIARTRDVFGPLLETFVFAELTKLASWSDEPPLLHHFRDRDGREVDFVLEAPTGEVVAIEVRARATVRESDFRALRHITDQVGSDLRLGLVLYDGDRVLPFGDRLFAAPTSSLWSG